METLCIYGCSGMGREIADLAYRLDKWKNVIFVDDHINNKIIDEVEVYSFQEVLDNFNKNDIEFIVTVGEPSLRKILYDKINEQLLDCANVVHPEFILSRSSTIANGVIIHTGAIATCNVHIGKGCLINKHVVIGHDVIVEDYCVISPNVTVGGNVKIGEGCYVGSGAIIRNGIMIGENSIIGMGAVVLKDVEPYSVMIGNPAKMIRKNIERRVFR